MKTAGMPCAANREWRRCTTAVEDVCHHHGDRLQVAREKCIPEEKGVPHQIPSAVKLDEICHNGVPRQRWMRNRLQWLPVLQTELAAPEAFGYGICDFHGKTSLPDSLLLVLKSW